MRGSRAGKLHLVHTHPVTAEDAPRGRGSNSRQRGCAGAGAPAGGFGSTNYVAPLTRGGAYRTTRTSKRGCPGLICRGFETKRRGTACLTPPLGGGGTNPYCGEMGCWGKRRGNRRSFLSTGRWGPPSGGQGWAGGRLRDAVGRKNRTEGWRTGMVWESGDGFGGLKPSVGPTLITLVTL